MATNPDNPHSLDNDGPWTALRPAVERSFQPAPDGAEGSTVLESLVHPAYPFVGAFLPGVATLSDCLRGLAEAYLARVQHSIHEARVFSQTLWADAVIPWHWHDLAWGANDPNAPIDARLSFWTGLDAAEAAASRTAVLLAGPQTRAEDGRQHVTGSGEGLRIVLHVDPPDGDGKRRVRITGATFANPPTAKSAKSIRLLAFGSPLRLFAALQDELRAHLAPASASEVRELSVSPAGSLRLAGHALAGTALHPRVVAWALQATPDGEPNDDRLRFRFEDEYRVELVTHATDSIAAFDGDPASAAEAGSMVGRRPTRDEQVLKPYLKPAAHRLPPKKTPGDPFLELQDAVDTPRVTVLGTPLSLNTFDPADLPQKVPADDLPLRSDDQAAVHAYLRGLELMDRLQGSGLAPETYFRFAKLPLVLRHHAAMRRGNPDGHSVNAQVRPMSGAQAFTAPYDPDLRPQLEVRFGAANLAHRDMGATYHGRRRPQYMGLAADRRWSWHEFGHVLSWAATGDLEFAFAHSAGDALAAILNDPESKLVHDGNQPARRAEPAAGLTFPWVPMKRRHDRDASLGWCWCGRRNSRRLSPRPPGARVFTGYFAEQLLSTTLFRVYRALGGDAKDAAVRHKAADYTVYLVMRAIQLLGPATGVAARQATHFFEALVQADVATPAWHYPMQDPPATPGAVRIGGMAHKVIRWAFEQQGLFANKTAREVVEGIGQAPAVDVHVFGDGSATDGGYGPHALDWTDAPGTFETPTPGWHASAEGLSVQAGELRFKLRNRGSQPALQVRAQAWVAPAGTAELDWQLLVLRPNSPTEADIGPGGFMTFSFATLATGSGSALTGPHFVLASASCRDDPSNLDPVTALPCAGQPPRERRQVAELVAGDNNIGLVLLDLQ